MLDIMSMLLLPYLDGWDILHDGIKAVVMPAYFSTYLFLCLYMGPCECSLTLEFRDTWSAGCCMIWVFIMPWHSRLMQKYSCMYIHMYIHAFYICMRFVNELLNVWRVLDRYKWMVVIMHRHFKLIEEHSYKFYLGVCEI